MSYRTHHRSRGASDEPTSSHHHHKRSRSPRQTHHHKRKRSRSPPPPLLLPFQAQRLTKHDFASYKPMLALYLDIQKQLVLEDLGEDEVKGRWKSFVGKCNVTELSEAELTSVRNRGELAEGWYDPSMQEKAIESSKEPGHEPKDEDHEPQDAQPLGRQEDARHGDDSSDDDVVGPALPNNEPRRRGHEGRRAGPAIPNLQELELQRELADEDAQAARADMRHARKLDRTQQKEALDELVPRADAGTRERQLEKKREKTETMRAFARAKSPGAVEEVGEGELMGDDGGMEGYKKVRKEVERKKNEREVRKEEMLRARAAEREERVREYQVKEERTMAMLRALAEQRFG